MCRLSPRTAPCDLADVRAATKRVLSCSDRSVGGDVQLDAEVLTSNGSPRRRRTGTYCSALPEQYAPRLTGTERAYTIENARSRMPLSRFRLNGGRSSPLDAPA